MGIRIGTSGAKRDWAEVATNLAEAALQALTLGPSGFSNAISALFRAGRGVRGEDSVETRATKLVFETLGFAIASTISSTQPGRKPKKGEIKDIMERLLADADNLTKQQEVIFQPEHLENPPSFLIFQNTSSAIFRELRLYNPKGSESDITARFQQFVTEGINRIRTKDPEYFSVVVQALSGPDSTADARSRAWARYRAELIRRFEDEPLFGEDRPNGVTLGQAYQPLRAWWDADDDDQTVELSTKNGQSRHPPDKKITRHIGMLETLVLHWLESNDKLDRVRLVSGGPGSGKTTFAKQLASQLASQARWRIVVVPLQRLRGAGPLEGRIDEYFRLQLDEPFDAETAPLASIGRDEHRDWLIIFDGLDELAKEGPGSESAAQDFASALADWRGRVGSIAIRFLVLGRAPSMQEARRRLGLHGKGTLYVADMIPFNKDDRKAGSGRSILLNDPETLGQIDQRPEFWRRWAIAKNLSLDPPQAMQASELKDLTKEPLLAYLLIFSGYVTDKWREAAENRNRIYRAIFDKIWERELTKATRFHLRNL